ncbi:MAG TPA: molybdopterin-dependent oxidoreductase [candidate division Zixibacteria bacterium]|nr:molybdopterin-dependent oxidoreductase [candidate division Zixibacteria bacterium]
MSTAALDRLLAVLVTLQLATGLLSLRAGSPPTAALFVVHGLLGGALLVAVAIKLWRSVPDAVANRRWGRLVLGVLLAGATLGALIGGFAWIASGRILTLGPWTVLTLHVIAALVLVPIGVFHLLPHRWRLVRPPAARPDRPRISRRTALATLGVGALGVVAWAASNVSDALMGGVRRFTGSRWLPDGGIPPPTTFFGEGAAEIDPATWRLMVDGAVERPLALSLDDLAALGRVERSAVLDCTSGWALRTDWSGTPLSAVLDAAGPTSRARLVTVRSVTGWYARLPLPEARGAVLATAVAGQPLPHGNGAPCRLVAPDRRGLEWVKWVTEIHVS